IDLQHFIRAMNPWPGAWTNIALPDGSQKMRVRISSPPLYMGGQGAVIPGTSHVSDAKDAITVACADGSLEIQQLQPEGKRPLSVAEFLRGAGRKYIPASK